MTPKLVVVIDTEEDWLEEHTSPAPVTNVAALGEFQARLFDTRGVRPLYVVNYPVANDGASMAMFREMVGSGGCEVGTHVHNWNSPPFTEADVRLRTYHTDIDRDVEKQKIADVTRLVGDGVGVAPVSFKGGRWGADGRTIQSLHELGYRVDTSVHPLTDFTDSGGGPNYFDAPLQPYFPSHDDLLRSDPDADARTAVLELPVSVGFTTASFERQRRWLGAILKRPWLRRLRLVGLAHRLRLLRRVKLSPETSTFSDMKRLVDASVAEGHALLHLTFHSCMLSVGTSPYSMTERERDVRIAHLGDILDYIVTDCGVEATTPAEFRDAWGGR